MYVVLFEDEGSAAGQRDADMQKHLAFLKANADKIKAAGPLRDSRSGLAAGGLWTVDCADDDQVWALIKADPFWPTGLRKAVTVLTWNKVFSALE